MYIDAQTSRQLDELMLRLKAGEPVLAEIIATFNRRDLDRRCDGYRVLDTQLIDVLLV
jgi:hypothetical protein